MSPSSFRLTNALVPEFSLKAGIAVLADTVSPLGEELHSCSSMDASRSPYARGPQEGAVLVSWPGETTAVISLSRQINNMSSPKHSHSSFA